MSETATDQTEAGELWAADVSMWGEQRAYSWWLEHRLAELLASLDECYPTGKTTLDGIAYMAPNMVGALRALLRVHAPRRLGKTPTVGAGASCRACSTGIVSHGDDGPSTHSVSWPCDGIVAVARELGLGPAPDGRYRYLLERLDAR